MFDPVHNGHLSSALSALEEFGLDEVRMIPCGSPVHRQAPISKDEDRIAMLELATQEESGLIVDSQECEATDPSYTFNTLANLRQAYPRSKLFLLLGMDSYQSLPTWYRWQEIFELAHIIVITRPGWNDDINEKLQSFVEGRQLSSFEEMNEYDQGKVLQYSFTPMMIGSTQIRQIIKSGKSVRYLMPDAVWAYIKTNKLYR